MASFTYSESCCGLFRIVRSTICHYLAYTSRSCSLEKTSTSLQVHRFFSECSSWRCANASRHVSLHSKSIRVLYRREACMETEVYIWWLEYNKYVSREITLTSGSFRLVILIGGSFHSTTNEVFNWLESCVVSAISHTSSGLYVCVWEVRVWHVCKCMSSVSLIYINSRPYFTRTVKTELK